jgi:hypothetical protein
MCIRDRYNRKAKEIDAHIWNTLMDPVDKEELHQVIKDLKLDLVLTWREIIVT